MTLFLDSFWRAVAYCLHPRVVGLSLLPLILLVLAAGGLAYFFWDLAVNTVFVWLESSAAFTAVADWLEGVGFANVKTVLAPLLVILAITPVLVVVVLFCVAVLMTPAIVRLVGLRRFPALERRHGASFLRSVLWSLGSTLLALVALVASLPLWAIPPLVLVLPPLIWGWLTYRVMAFDALAEHATREEQRQIFQQQRSWLFAIGVTTGYLGAAPTALWAAAGWLLVPALPLLLPLAIWLYTLVFAFSSLWFAHFCLAALARLRGQALVVDAEAMPAPPEPLSPLEQLPPPQ